MRSRLPSLVLSVNKNGHSCPPLPWALAPCYLLGLVTPHQSPKEANWPAISPDGERRSKQERGQSAHSASPCVPSDGEHNHSLKFYHFLLLLLFCTFSKIFKAFFFKLILTCSLHTFVLDCRPGCCSSYNFSAFYIWLHEQFRTDTAKFT